MFSKFLRIVPLFIILFSFINGTPNLVEINSAPITKNKYKNFQFNKQNKNRVFSPDPSNENYFNTSFPFLRNADSNIDLEQFSGELCSRPCQPGDRRICYFKFVLEHYQAMGVACKNCKAGIESDCESIQCILGDGFEKGVMSINRQIPGPAIQVCQGDLIVVDTVNLAGGTAATIHWHGLHMRATPWMDGVPFVTQCPIPFSTTFRYKYWATEPGTQFYHSHAGHHKVNGQYGALIIRQPLLEDKHVFSYDFDLPEHYILISDWMHQYGENLFPGIPSFGGIFPDSVLINGRGSNIDRISGKRTSVPPTRYYVRPGKRYRFRIINSISHSCPFQIQIANHTLTVIASDSYNVKPHDFNTLVTNSGERYDIVVETNQPIGDYWIRVRGLGVCDRTDSVALLRYQRNGNSESEDALRPLPVIPDHAVKYPSGEILNHPNSTCYGLHNIHCVTELQALDEDIELRFSAPNYRLFLSFNNYPVQNSEIFQTGMYHHFINIEKNITLAGAVNNLSLIFPPSPPLTQSENIDEETFCDEFNIPTHCIGKHLCPCVHRLRVRTGSIVELIVIDESREVGRMHHPFHLHGHAVMVTGLAQHPFGLHMTRELAEHMEATRLRSRSQSNFNSRPPWKDTVSIPSYGYAVFRFRASNPGYWLLHCHYEWHIAIGMGLIVQVGEQDEMVPPPKEFPKCGNYLPKILEN